MKFTATGNFRIGERKEKFTKDVEAKDGEEAKERIYTIFGSEHGTKRRFIQIDKVDKAKPEPAK
jgi:large subunit ribosomal protein LX